jgi:hypothetical protein
LDSSVLPSLLLAYWTHDDQQLLVPLRVLRDLREGRSFFLAEPTGITEEGQRLPIQQEARTLLSRTPGLKILLGQEGGWGGNLYTRMV